MSLGSVWELYGVIGGHLYWVWDVFRDTMGVIGGHLYEVWEVYGDPMGVIGVLYMRFRKCTGT